MAQYTVFLDYIVHLTKREDVLHMQTTFPNGQIANPDYNSTFWGAPIQFVGQPFTAPSVRSPHFIFGNNNYPRNVNEFNRKSGGWFGISWLFGDTTRFKWRAKFVLTPIIDEPTINDQPVQPNVTIARRKWIEGFEVPVGGESNGVMSNDVGGSVSRDSSRHPDGLGLSIRSELSPAGFLRSISDIAGVAASTSSWERFYIRIRLAPNQTTPFWQMRNTSLNGVNLRVTAGLTLSLEHVTGGGFIFTPFLTAPPGVLLLDTWYRIDVVFRFSTTVPVLKLYLNRAKIFEMVAGDTAGMGANTNHSSSAMGHVVDASTLEMDVDDWICSEWPSVETSSDRNVGLDWLYGSKVQLVRPSGFLEPDHDDWTDGTTDNWRALVQVPISGGTSNTSLGSDTPLDELAVTTDVVRNVTALPNNAGIAAFNVCSRCNSTTSAHGYRLNDAALVTEARTSGSGWKTMMYRPAGIVKPDPVTSLSLHLIKDSGGGAVTVNALVASVEVLGIWGEEDVADEEIGNPTTIPPRLGCHNAPYPESPWAREGSRARAPVIAHSGIYTGNGDYQELIFRLPVNWLWVRRTDGSSTGAHWFSSMIGAHSVLDKGVIPDSIAQALIDPDFVGDGLEDSQEQRTLIRIVGNLSVSNESGVPYQYVAVSDPGARFMLNGAFNHDSDVASISNVLFKAGFLPIASFFSIEDCTLNSVDGLGYKGPGHATTAGSLLSAAETAVYAEFGTSVITSKVALHSDTKEPVAYSAWRTVDGSGGVPVQIMSYTGNGSGARTINLTPVSLRRPLFGLVVPHNGVSYQRDPSHTGSNSQIAMTNTSSSTAITGGDIDKITVGATLNASGVVYDVFVIPGGTLACENGWSCNGEFITIIDDEEDPDEDEGDDEDDDDNEDDEEDEDSEPIGPPDEFAFELENAASRALRLANLCSRVLHRLGDSAQVIWAEEEIDSYIQQAMFEMVTLTRLVWDQLYLENIPPGFHCTMEDEEDLLEHEFHYGVAACTQEWELEYGETAGFWLADEVSWGNHTSPAELPYLARLGLGTMLGTAIMPTSLIEIERSSWDHRTMEALSVRGLIDNDSRFEETEGEVFGYTWRKDGPRTFRKMRVPAEMAQLMTTDGSFGIARNIDDPSESEGVAGTWGIPRRIRGWHPMGSTVGYGLPRRFYYDSLNVKVEHWRKFEALCKQSELKDGEIQNFAGEIPRHYFLYIGDYCQWMALKRNGPGRNYKLAQLYKDRWDRNLGRIKDRIGRQNKERVYRAGGNDPAPRGGPPRPRLPWQYGKRVR